MFIPELNLPSQNFLLPTYEFNERVLPQSKETEDENLGTTGGTGAPPTAEIDINSGEINKNDYDNDITTVYSLADEETLSNLNSNHTNLFTTDVTSNISNNRERRT